VVNESLTNPSHSPIQGFGPADANPLRDS
jgi:hypothetical protein